MWTANKNDEILCQKILIHNEEEGQLWMQNLIVEESPLNWVSISFRYNLNRGDLQHQLSAYLL